MKRKISLAFFYQCKKGIKRHAGTLRQLLLDWHGLMHGVGRVSSGEKKASTISRAIGSVQKWHETNLSEYTMIRIT